MPGIMDQATGNKPSSGIYYMIKNNLVFWSSSNYYQNKGNQALEIVIRLIELPQQIKHCLVVQS